MLIQTRYSMKQGESRDIGLIGLASPLNLGASARAAAPDTFPLTAAGPSTRPSPSVVTRRSRTRRRPAAEHITDDRRGRPLTVGQTLERAASATAGVRD